MGNQKHNTKTKKQNVVKLHRKPHAKGTIEILPLDVRGNTALHNNPKGDPSPTPRDGININPPEYFAQSFKRDDIQTFDIHTKCLHTEDTYENDNKANAQHRVSWVIPETVQNKVGDAVRIQRDSRGQLSNISRVKVHFVNHLHDDITVEGNVPHGDLDRKDVLVERTNAFKYCLKPLQTKTITIMKYGDKNNLFGPLISSAATPVVRSMALLDFTGKTPNVSEYTENKFSDDRVALSVIVEVRYIVMGHMPTSDADIDTINRPKFGLQLLGSLQEMTQVSVRTQGNQMITKVKGSVGDSAPKWVRVEDSHGDYICLSEVSAEKGYNVGLFHCNSDGSGEVPVALEGVETSDTRLVIPGIAATTDRRSIFVAGALLYSKRHGMWCVEDPSSSDNGLLNRADPDVWRPIVSKMIPIMVFNDLDAGKKLIKAKAISQEDLMDGLSKVINVIETGLEIASFFL